MDISRKEMKRLLEADDEDLEMLLGKILVELTTRSMADKAEEEEEKD